MPLRATVLLLATLCFAAAACAETKAAVKASPKADAKADARADAKLGRQLKHAMLHQPADVPVIIRWKAGHAGSSRRLGRAVTREIPMFSLTAAHLPAARIAKLARSRLVDKLFYDVDAGGPEGKETPATEVTELDREEKGAGSTWGLRAIQAPRVWKELEVTGRGVRVGVVDSGLDPRVFPGRLAAFRDFSSEPSDQPTDPAGHGTHVAGTIGGEMLAGHVHIGVAPRCQFVIGRAINSRNSLTSSQGIAALAFVADPDGNPETDDGARVINCSFSNFPREDDELWKACIERLHARNVLPIFSAANNGAQGEDSVGSPGVLSGSFTIGAVGPEQKRWNDSSFSGPRLGNRPRGFLKPDLMGPGVDTLSISALDFPRRMSGTSMATPHVVGVVALMLEVNPRLTVKEIREILEDSAVGLSDRWKTAEYGSGLVDAFTAVQKSRALAAAPPATPTVEQLLAEGEAAVEANNLPRAIDRLISVINTVRGDLSARPAQQAMFTLSSAYARQGNFRAAVNGYRKLLEISPAGPFADQARFELGMAYRRTPTADAGEQVRAQQQAARELEAFVKAFPAHVRAGEAMVERAQALADSGQLREAAAQARAILEKFGTRPELAGPAQELLERLDGQGEDPLGD